MTALLRVMALLSVTLLLMLLSVVSARAQSLSKRLDARLDTTPFDRQFWGVVLVDESGKVVYGRNERRLFTPASDTKIVVAAVASALLPPDWTVRTSLYGAGPLVDGVLQGDLVLYGRGDPTMGRHCFSTDTVPAAACERDPFTRLRQLADSLRARGVREIRGDVVGDGSYFESLIIDPDWQGYDLNWWYAAPVSGLGFNDNSVDFTWAPGLAAGAPAVITMFPNLGDVAFENRTLTVPAGGVSDIGDRFYRVPGTLEIWAEGTVALDHPPQVESFALPDPNLYTARALRSVLAEAGISVAGATGSTVDSLRYRQARSTAPLAEVASRPLREWIFPILNTSQNWYAEMLLKQLGKRFGGTGSWEAGLNVERRLLIDSVKVDSSQIALVDGSGLSSSNLVSPLAFTRILRFIRHHPRGAAFVAALPRSGQRGSLRSRFVHTPLEGRVRAKDGYIAEVNTLSGFIEKPGGKALTFSIQANHHTLPSKVVLAVIDSLVIDMGKGR